MTKTSLRWLGPLLAALSFVVQVDASTAADTVVMVLPVRVPAFDEIERGLKSFLADRTVVRVFLGSDYQGKPGGIIQAALDERPVCVLAVGTTMSRAFLAAGRENMPPIFCVAISNPVDVLGADGLSTPRLVNATVVTDGPTSIYPGTADLIASLYPQVRKIGTVFNPGESNSVSNRDYMREQCRSKNWQLVEKAIGDVQDVEPAARALLESGVEAIWIGKDRVMTSQPERMIELAHGAGIPVFACDAGTVEAFGALGTRSVAFEELGRYIGRLVERAQKGESLRDMPVSTVEQTTTFLSRPAIAQLNLQVPDAVAATATLVGVAAQPDPGSPQTVVVFTIIVVVALIAIAMILRRRRTV